MTSSISKPPRPGITRLLAISIGAVLVTPLLLVALILAMPMQQVLSWLGLGEELQELMNRAGLRLRWMVADALYRKKESEEKRQHEPGMDSRYGVPLEDR